MKSRERTCSRSASLSSRNKVELFKRNQTCRHQCSFWLPVASPSINLFNVFLRLFHKIHFTHIPRSFFSFFRLGTSLFIWTNESPLFFRGPFVAKLATLQAAGLSCGVWLDRSGTLFSQTLHGLRWPPSDGSLRSGFLRHCQFCLFFDGPSPSRSAQNSAGFQTLDRPHVFAKPSESKLCYKRQVLPLW